MSPPVPTRAGLGLQVFAVREAAIQTIGRLMLRNPAHAMPPMRHTLVQLLTALENGREDKREKASRLIGQVVLASHHLLKPYVAPVLQQIVPKLSDPNPNVAANVLKAIGWMARTGGAEVERCQDAIFPLILEALQVRLPPPLSYASPYFPVAVVGQKTQRFDR